MKTTVMFINEAAPLVDVPVRLAGDSNIHITDAEGKIVIDVISGTHTFEIEIDRRWVSRTFARKGDAPLFIIDLSKSREAALSTMNTLQMDLANLVGDRYVFETVLGRGGMGIVVKAIDRLLNRPVAIKMLSDELQDNEEAQQIFLVEARNLATLSHPNLVAIHDILSVDGRVLMVFEYVLGENLEKTIERTGAIPQLSALRMLIQLTRCVSYLHDHELIHRDLKPANVIVQGDGTVKLVDFGLARSLNELYVRGTRVRGTPAYMAPEQVMGIHLTVSTDLYQLGITMYEMLAGELPYPSGDMAYAHVHKVPPLLSEKYPIDLELCALVASCLKKQPKDRPASARELLDQLSQIYARLSSDEEMGLGQLSEPSAAFIEATRTSTRTSGSMPAVRVDDHFTEIESGEFEISMDEKKKGVPVYVPWLVGAGVAVLIIAVGVSLINKPQEGPLDSTGTPTSSANIVASERRPIEEPVEVPVEIAPQDPAEELAPAEPEVEARPEVAAEAVIAVPKAKIAPNLKAVQKVAPSIPVASVPVEAEPVEVVQAPEAKVVEKPVVKKKDDEVLLIPAEPKKTGGLLNVGGDTEKSSGGFLPTN
jgi:serine/threonine protein kinase